MRRTPRISNGLLSGIPSREPCSTASAMFQLKRYNRLVRTEWSHHCASRRLAQLGNAKPDTLLDLGVGGQRSLDVAIGSCGFGLTQLQFLIWQSRSTFRCRNRQNQSCPCITMHAVCTKPEHVQHQRSVRGDGAGCDRCMPCLCQLACSLGSLLGYLLLHEPSALPFNRL